MSRLNTDEKLDEIIERLDKLESSKNGISKEWFDVIQYAQSNSWNPEKVHYILKNYDEVIVPIFVKAEKRRNV